MAAKGRRRSWRWRLLPPALLAVGLLTYGAGFDPGAEDVAGQRAALAGRERPALLQKVDAPALLADLKTLAAPAMEGRAIGTPGSARARDYLLARYRGIGLEPVGASFEQAFSYTPGRGLRFWRARFWQARAPVAGVNLVGRITGTQAPDEYLVVSAHYDHLGLRGGRLYPGADDNASGVAAMLAAARWFKAHPPRHSILFLALDGEERGLRGARAFMAAPPVPRQAMLLNVNLDMLSRNAAGEIFASGLHANPQLQALIDPVRADAVPTILYGHDHPRPFWDGNDWTGSSDHAAFHDAGIPHVYFGVEDHADYHAPGDTFERIDQVFYAGVVEAVIDAIAALDAADAAQLARR